MQAPLLPSQIGHDEFDYQVLLDCLHGYERPRDKITNLLNKGVIVRVKKGLYVFGEAYRRRPVSREVLANLIYGPSYISLEYALQYHGLIPEAVETVTSVTSGRSRSFATPFGVFTYRRIPIRMFETGMDRMTLDDGRSFLIATPEKALADKIAAERGTGMLSQAELREHLIENLRMDPNGLRRLDLNRLSQIAEHSRSRKLRLLSRLVARLQNTTERLA